MLVIKPSLVRTKAQALPFLRAALPMLQNPLSLDFDNAKLVAEGGDDDGIGALVRACHSRGRHLPSRVARVDVFVAVQGSNLGHRFLLSWLGVVFAVAQDRDLRLRTRLASVTVVIGRDCFVHYLRQPVTPVTP